MRDTPRNSIAAVTPAAPFLLTAHDGYVVADPAAVRHAALDVRGALGFRRAPELDLLEILEAVGLATLGAQQRVALAGLRHHRVGAEPGGDVTLHLRRDRPLEPGVGAVRIVRTGREHGGVRPARGSLFRHGG